jgi:hypothetical protein
MKLINNNFIYYLLAAFPMKRYYECFFQPILCPMVAKNSK